MADPDDQPYPRGGLQGREHMEWCLALARRSLGPRRGTARAERPVPRPDAHEMAGFDVVYVSPPAEEPDDGTF